MFDRMRSSVRRARQSSSDSEPSTPLKYQKMADRPGPMGEDPGSPNQRSIDDLYAVLKDIQKDNKETRSYMESRFDKFANDMKGLINTSVSALQTDMQNEFARVDSLFENINDRITSIEASTRNPAPALGPKSEFDTSRNLCFKNLKEEEHETIENLKLYVENVLASINVNVKVACVKRVGEPRPENADNANNAQNGPRTRFKPTIVTLENVDQVLDVLRAKQGLKDIDQFSRVFIEHDKTRAERIMEANIRTLVNKVPGLRVRGGRVLRQ